MTGALNVTADERALDGALAAILPPGVHAACRAIRRRDQALLLPEEAATITSRKDRMRDASGAARHVARGLLGQAGLPAAPILILAASGAPVWPAGVIGSMAHDDAFAVAVVASEASFAGVGIDVEPAEPLAEDVAAIVRMPGDVLEVLRKGSPTGSSSPPRRQSTRRCSPAIRSSSASKTSRSIFRAPRGERGRGEA